jgi:hypothetical protein
MTGREQDELEKRILEMLSGYPLDDVAVLARVLGKIAKTINPNLKAQFFMDSFGVFWETVLGCEVEIRHSDGSPIKFTDE